MIVCKIDVKKIDKAHLFTGAKGVYLDIALIANKDGGTDQYGNDGFISQGLSKEARARGEKGPIIGNWRKVESRQPATPAAQDDGGRGSADLPF